ncbi:hypothetical protein P261_02356 [Lachnospiraceae bacterium TWA4]|nr:hypothetical protein P261_02356 [Lachnospiraceae bacterium TWA4]
MATIKTKVYENQKPTKEQIEEIHEAITYPVEPDDDCPELTDEQLMKLASMAKEQRAKKKQLVSLRVSPDTLEKAKKLGAGYTGILSRLLDLAINDAEMLERSIKKI